MLNAAPLRVNYIRNEVYGLNKNTWCHRKKRKNLGNRFVSVCGSSCPNFAEWVQPTCVGRRLHFYLNKEQKFNGLTDEE